MRQNFQNFLLGLCPDDESFSLIISSPYVTVRHQTLSRMFAHRWASMATRTSASDRASRMSRSSAVPTAFLSQVDVQGTGPHPSASDGTLVSLAIRRMWLDVAGPRKFTKEVVRLATLTTYVATPERRKQCGWNVAGHILSFFFRLRRRFFARCPTRGQLASRLSGTDNRNCRRNPRTGKRRRRRRHGHSTGTFGGVSQFTSLS